MTHEEVQELLALSAAGLLDAEGERAVRGHIAECALCAAQLEQLGAISAGLSARPAPPIPEAVLLRTQFGVAAELALHQERRRGVRIAAMAAVFAWIMNLATWILIRWWRPELSGAVAWLAVSTLTACAAVPAAAILARRRRPERRTL